MLVLVTYDVSTKNKQGSGRLNRVAKKCIAYGKRVQNSVFECFVDWQQFVRLQNDLKEIINQDEDSLRFYVLGNKYNGKVIHIGQMPSLEVEGNLIV